MGKTGEITREKTQQKHTNTVTQWSWAGKKNMQRPTRGIWKPFERVAMWFCGSFQHPFPLRKFVNDTSVMMAVSSHKPENND